MVRIDRKKSRVKKEKSDPAQLTEHHTRPTSIYGTNRKVNIKMVRRDVHMAWHDVFGNMCVEQIAETIREIIGTNRFHVRAVRKPDPTYNFRCRKLEKKGRKCGISCRKKRPLDELVAPWNKLNECIAKLQRATPSLMHTIAYINANLIDRDYCLEIVEVVSGRR